MTTEMLKEPKLLPFPWMAVTLCAVLPIPVLLYWLFEYLVRERREIVSEGDDVYDDDDEEVGTFTESHRSTGSTPSSQRSPSKDSLPVDIGIKVLFASLEHAVPGLPKARAVAGGLGKVVDLISRHHPGDIYMVHPMVGEDGKVSYKSEEYELTEDEPLQVQVDNVRETVKVFHHTVYLSGDDGFRADFLLLSHPLFLMRTKESIYPNPMTRRGVLRFFSLWNQAVGALLARHKPHVYHCPDFHTAIAPWYAVGVHPKLRVVLTLHNAEYQGGISTDMIRSAQLPIMAQIWNLTEEQVAKHLVYQGRFNMLKAAVDFIEERQMGKGVCAVSKQYANEVYTMYSIFWNIQSIAGLENPMLEEERTQLFDSLEITKAKAKKEIQELCELNPDPDARLFVSLGRLVRQKGVDLLADITPWLLKTYPNAQLMIVGPVADGFGCYAKEKLEAAAQTPEFKGRLFIKCEFWRAPPALKLATDFCLMPSRDEPFGYVDIEFAWCGAAMVGAKAGGLGKVPGFYYRAQNRDNLDRLRRELKTVISLAMRATSEQLASMGEAGLKCKFPLRVWQKRTVDFYTSVLTESTLRALRGEQSELIASRSLPSEGSRLKQEKITPMVDVAVAKQKTFCTMPQKSANEEFLTQELTEDELADRIRERISESPHMTIEQILKSVGADVNKEREHDNVARWLLGEFLGEPRIHWLVCCGYISSFASSLVTNVVAIYWGYKSTKFGEDKLFVISFNWGDIDLPSSWMPLLVTSVDAIGFVIGAPIWASLASCVEPRRLLAGNLLLKPLLLLVIGPFQPNAAFALFLIFIQGLINSGGLLFVVFNFMMTIEADMSRVALRMGMLEMCRYAVTWGLSAYVFMSAPANQGGEDTDDWMNTRQLLPIMVIVLICTVLPGVLILSAPGPYRNDRFPGWDLSLLFRRKSFVFLCLSELCGDFAKFPSGMFLSWSMANHWKSSQLGIFCLVFVAFFTVCTGFWSFALSKASVHGFAFLIGVVMLLAPPAILRAIVLEEVSTYNYRGRSEWALAICALSLLLEGIRTSSIWAAQIRILNSRWRLLSYGTIFYMIGHTFVASSPWFNEFFLAQYHGASFLTTSQKQLADAVVVSLIPISAIQFILQLCAMPFIRRDMGIPGKTKKQERQANLHWLWRYRHFLRAAARAIIVVLLIVAFFQSYNNVYKPLEFEPVHNCHVSSLTQLPTTCKEISETIDKDLFGLNEFGQNTTARTACFERMVEEDGDTFVFKLDYCKVLHCGELEMSGFKGSAYVRHALSGTEVWSRHCSMSGQNLILVELFEWSWKDVMHECEDYLAPAGFDAVAVSPPTEHIQGDTWWVRYQPVSYKLNSRSGTEDEFREMVRRCQAAGVAVMSDVVLNHMAATWIVNPSEYAGQECGPDTVPCEGWHGTRFGSRQFLNGDAGLDNFTRGHFHHYPNDDTSNCGCPPWLNNQVMCDFSGLPDLDTESFVVRQMLVTFLKKLHDMGVTMLRVDAGRHMFPESQAWIYNKIPWDYVALEVYHDVKKSNPVTFDKLLQLGSLYDFAYSMMLTENFVDYPYGGTKNWTCRDKDFKNFLNFGPKLQNCFGTNWICETPVPEDKTMLFVDNHDRQRERFKEGKSKNDEEFPPMCDWDVSEGLHDCLINFKYGLQYHVMQAFILTNTYGDAVRLMSSFAFFTYRQGPPGVKVDSLRDGLLPVFTKESDKFVASRCRSKPITSPVTPEWDGDQDKPWICEHRWEGISGMVRFRKLVMQNPKRNKLTKPWHDDQGRIAYSLGDVGFVALSRGWNWLSQCGANESKNLSGLSTGMPNGTFCNLARLDGAVPAPIHWTPAICKRDTVTIDENGKISRGLLPNGELIVLHKDFPAEADVDPVEVVVPSLANLTDVNWSTSSDFWGWRRQRGNTEVEQKGCCYTLDVTVYEEAQNLKTWQASQQDCLENGYDAAENSNPRKIGFNLARCPASAEEGFELILFAQRKENATSTTTLVETRYWADTALLFALIVVGESLICVSVMACHRPVKVDPARQDRVPSNIEMGSVLLEQRS